LDLSYQSITSALRNVKSFFGKMENNNDPNITNVNSLWLQNIFNQLITLKESLALARDGFFSVPELLETSPLDLGQIQYRNFRFVLTIFDSMLNDVQSVVAHEYLASTQNIIQKLKTQIDENIFNFFQRVNQPKPHFIPLPYYYKAIEVLEKMRARLLLQLSPLLYVQGDLQKSDKSSELIK